MDISALLKDFLTVAMSNEPLPLFCRVATITLFLAYFLKVFLIRALFKDMRKIGKDVLNASIRIYLGYAWLGWVLILIGIMCIEMFYMKSFFVLPADKPELAFAVGVIFILTGILLNTRNFFKIYVECLKEKLR